MSFFDSAYELQNSWTQTDRAPQHLSKNELDNVRQAIVRDHSLEDGTVIKNVVFLMKNGKPRSMKLSPYNEQFKNGTKINAASVEISEFTNEDGDLKYTVTCDEA